MDINIETLTEAQQMGLAALQIQANWFGKYFMRQADRLVGSLNPRNDT